jgi:hypothetical protein
LSDIIEIKKGFEGLDKNLLLKFILAFFILCCTNLYSKSIQNTQLDTLKSQNRYRATIINGDTVPIVYLQPFFAVDKKVFKNDRKKRKYYTLVAKVKKVLPIARDAGKRYLELNKQLVSKTDNEKKDLMHRVEREIKRDYKDRIERLSYSEGAILLKLIDRETGSTAYSVVKELRGTFSAWFWNGVATFFDANLKSEYDPQNDDKDIEDIVYMIDHGLL